MTDTRTHEKLRWELGCEGDPEKPIAFLRNGTHTCVTVSHDSEEDHIRVEVHQVGGASPRNVLFLYPTHAVMSMVTFAFDFPPGPTRDERIAFRSAEGYVVRVPVGVLLEVIGRASLLS